MDGEQQRDFIYLRDESPNAADENSVEGYILTESSSGGTVNFREENINLPVPAAEQLANPKLASDAEAEEYDFN